MAEIAITHVYQSLAADDGTDRVGPDEWNDGHLVADGAITGLQVANTTLATTKLTDAAQLFLVPTGGIINWSGNVANIPSGWLLCDGSSQLKASYPALNTIMGTIHGAGDASNFVLPDLRDKFIVGAKQDSSSKAMSNVEGSLKQSAAPTHTHTGPSHTHTGPSHTHAMAIYIGTGSIRTKASAGGEYGQSLISGEIVVNSNTGGYGTTVATEAFSLTGGAEKGAATRDATDADGTGATGASGTAASGATAPIPTYYALAYIVKV